MSVCLSVGWSVLYTINGLLLHLCLFLQNYSFRSIIKKKVTRVYWVSQKNVPFSHTNILHVYKRSSSSLDKAQKGK